MKIILTLLLLILQYYNTSAQKITVKDASINDVTIYTSSAEILYEKNLSLTKGKNIIKFTDLTPFIIENSTNVSLSDKSVKIVTVTDKINYLKNKENNYSFLDDSVETKSHKLGIINCNIEALEKEKILLFNNESIGGVSQGVAVSEIEKASEFFHKRILTINLELFKLNKQKEKLSNEIDKLKLYKKEITTTDEEAISEITIVVQSEKDQSIMIHLKIHTANAGWAPLYDLKYNAPNKPLDFIFRANVFNATNIDWNDVKIRLSTASPLVGLKLPSLNESDTKSRTSLNYQDQSIEFINVQTNNIISEYEIKYNYSIPSDAKPYLVDVDEFRIESNYSYILIPILEQSGFLMANIPNWNKYKLLSGTTNIYNRGVFLGKTFLNTITDNDTLDVYIGKDNLVQAFRKEKSSENMRKIIGNNYIEKSVIEIEIRNNNNYPVNIKLLDQVPVYERKDKVKTNLINTEKAKFRSSDGLLTWYYTVDPNGSLKQEFGYSAKMAKNISEGNYMLRRKSRAAIPCPKF